MARDIVKVKARYNITITKPIRERVPIKTGQLMEIYTEGEKIMLVPIPDPSERLTELIGDLDRELIAEEAEKISIKEADKSLKRKSMSR